VNKFLSFIELKTLIPFGIFIMTNITIFWGSMKWLKINEHNVYYEDLPEHLDGFRILQIADLHNRLENKKTLNIWQYVNNLKFDIATITGDVVLSKLSEIFPHKEDLKNLANKVPTFYIEGNHEYKNFKEFKNFFTNIGINVLDNKKYTIKYKNGNIDIIGTRDYTHLKKNNFNSIYKLFEKNKSDNFKLVLTHQPQTFDYFKDTSPNLVLSGHTHGGQLRIPFFPTLYAPQQGFFPKYGNGFYNYKKSKLYVSKGIGSTHFPFRYFNRPEISIFILKKGNEKCKK